MALTPERERFFNADFNTGLPEGEAVPDTYFEGGEWRRRWGMVRGEFVPLSVPKRSR